MRFIKQWPRWLVGPLLAGCTAAPRAPEPLPVAPAPSISPPTVIVPAPAPQPSESVKPAGLGPPRAVRTAQELRRQAAERLVAANPDRIYLGKPPPVLLAIPVLEVELRADGSVKRVQVLRKPGQAPETLQLAIDAIHRAAPFGDVRRMPQPWVFTETFLFDDQRRFKPRTLD